MREKVIEQKLSLMVKKRGGICPKFVSPGYDGMPDRIVLLPGCHFAFVEVKARGSKSKGAPAEAVTLAKQKKILQTALLYLQETQSTLQPRFDVAEVFFTSGSGIQISEIRYIADAFTQNESNS